VQRKRTKSAGTEGEGTSRLGVETLRRQSSSILFAPPPPPFVAVTGVVMMEVSHVEIIRRTSGGGGHRSFVTAPDVIVMEVSCAERTFRKEASGLSILFVSGCVCAHFACFILIIPLALLYE